MNNTHNTSCHISSICQIYSIDLNIPNINKSEAAMRMRPTPGYGTLDSPSLVLPVSLLLKQRRSARGHSAGVQLQRAPGRPWPGKPPRVLLRLMQTYDMYIPVIYLSYPLDQ